ncbi:NAD-dependent protein deacetylase Hst1p [Diutina rugosa]
MTQDTRGRSDISGAHSGSITRKRFSATLGDTPTSKRMVVKIPSPTMSPRPEVDYRQYIKERGVLSFIYSYLPDPLSKQDLRRVIGKLGYPLSSFPPLDTSPLREIIEALSSHLVLDKDLDITIQNPSLWMSSKPRYTVDRFLDDLRVAKKIVVVTGAGISTSLGIPDFRSIQGIYKQVEHLKLEDPQDVFDIRVFNEDPTLFYNIAYKLLPADEHQFSVLHSFIRLLQDKGKLLRNYTQNIDDLEVSAGIDKAKLIQCHGSFHCARCISCKARFKGEKIHEHIRKQQVPRCNACWGKPQFNQTTDVSYGVVKPDITFFGESLPKRFFENCKTDLQECDLFIAIGTSLKVSPVSDMVSKTSRKVKRILINRDPIVDRNFDLTLTGNCDDVATFLCQHLGSDWDLPHPKFDPTLPIVADDVDVFENIYNVHQEPATSVNSSVLVDERA